MTVADIITGRYGQLIMTGWIGEAPTGREEAYLILATPDDRAGVTMPVVAKMLGIGATGAPVSNPGVVVTLGADGWVTLHVGGERFARPVTGAWSAMARENGRVVLCVAFEPMPADLGTGEYADQLAVSGAAGVGMVPVRR